VVVVVEFAGGMETDNKEEVDTEEDLD